MNRRTLFVGGLSTNTRSRDVAREFERFGKLVRCDMPAPGGRPRGYAFIEFENERDAEEAYDAMKYKKIDGREISLQWARREPAKSWRYEGLHRSRSRSRSPRRDRGRSPRREERGRSPRRDDRGRSPRRDDRGRSPRRDDRGRSPPRGRSPRRDDRDERTERRASPRREERPRSPLYTDSNSLKRKRSESRSPSPAPSPKRRRSGTPEHPRLSGSTGGVANGDTNDERKGSLTPPHDR